MNEDGLSVLELGPHRPPYLLVSNPHLVGEFLRASGSQPNRPGFLGIHVKRSRYTVNGKAGSKGKGHILHRKNLIRLRGLSRRKLHIYVTTITH